LTTLRYSLVGGAWFVLLQSRNSPLKMTKLVTFMPIFGNSMK